MNKDLMYRSLDSIGQTGDRLAKSPPEEPDASIAHVRVCEGSGRQRPGLLGKKKKNVFKKVFKIDPEKVNGVPTDFLFEVSPKTDKFILNNDSSEPVEICVRLSKKKISSRRVKSEYEKK